METKEIVIPTERSEIKGSLTLVPQSKSLVVFAHGSGSSRHSSRNKFVANILHEAHLSTFLFDLLTAQEDDIDTYTREFRFDITLLASRLVLVTRWLQNDQQAADLNIGFFGSSTGAAAALIAAAQMPGIISAVVSRGGRVDLAGDNLPFVRCPTLFIVGQLDYEVIRLNESAYAQLQCTKKLAIIAHATHLFEEPGTLQEAANSAKDWFTHYL